MTSLVSLLILKEHLGIDADDTSEDLLLTSMVPAAQAACELQINCAPGGADLGDQERHVLRQAMLLVLGSWYQNREGTVTGTISGELPLAVTWLLKPLRRIPVPAVP